MSLSGDPGLQVPGDTLPVLTPQAVALGFRCVLVATALWGLYGGPWLSLAANRLLLGEPFSALTILGPYTHVGAAILAAALGLAAMAREGHLARLASVALLLALIIMLVIQTGLEAAGLMQVRPSAARAMLGASFWMVLASLALLVLDGVRQLGTGKILACALITIVALGAAARAGAFDALSLFVEFRARADVLQSALLRHVALSAAALVLALSISLPLGWLAFRSQRFRSGLDATLNGLQVVPALALFGFLVSMLSVALAAWPAMRSLGIAAIGPAPAVMGVVCYLALPLTRSVAAGLASPDGAVVEAARAMGMAPGRVAWEVRLPLGLPIFVGGLRVATVQSIGLVTLGGLIGAGGFGTLVFEGMAQFASDLILLGSAPVILIAIVADAGLKEAENLTARPLA